MAERLKRIGAGTILLPNRPALSKPPPSLAKRRGKAHCTANLTR